MSSFPRPATASLQTNRLPVTVASFHLEEDIAGETEPGRGRVQGQERGACDRDVEVPVRNAIGEIR